MATPTLLRGYEIRDQLGSGGFGAVYRAFQPILNRDVALKVILPQYANDPDFIRRFETEAQLIARLEHPHIVPLFEYWREPDGAYLVMRWIRGGQLTTLLTNGPLDNDRALRLLSEVGAALYHAHLAGVIHLDIKPDNILIDQEENAYLTDFGISQIIGPNRTSVELSDFSGTLRYAAPEQITGGKIGTQTDLYALGFVTYELLTGRYVYEGQTQSQILFFHVNDPLPDIGLLRPDLPRAVNDVLQKTTDKVLQNRYRDVPEFLAALRAALGARTKTTATAPTPIDQNVILPNPYKGLRPFEQGDANDFFGRTALVNQLVERLGENHSAKRFLAVVGPSGSGKSSVVHAGLEPALRQGALPGSDRWFVAEMVPGTNPLRRLEAALTSVSLRPPVDLYELLTSDARGLVWAVDRVIGDTDTELLLVIDQFEELFTQVESEQERGRFHELLYEAATSPNSRVRIIITLRADFYDRPLLYENLGAMVQARTQVVLPLSSTEIQAVVSGPAHRLGVQVDADLLAAIVADVREEAGSLPLLQYTLTELFKRREGHRLTLAAYRLGGGLLGTLAQSADDVYRPLSPSYQELARQIFLRLVTLGEGIEDTRRRVRRAELLTLANADDVNAVLDAFGGARLLTFDAEQGTRDPTVEVAHEALIQTWRLLRDWIAESRSDIRIERQVAAMAAEWDTSERNASYLARGARLEQLEQWETATSVTVTALERDYLKASAVERQRQIEAETARREREARLERRSRNFLRGLVAILLIATLGALGLTALAVNQSGAAQQARSTSDSNAALAAFNAGTAADARNNAEIQAATALAARSTSDWNQARALTEAAGATRAQGEAVNQAATSNANVTLAVAAQSTAQRSNLESRSLAWASSARSALTAFNGDLGLALAIQAVSVPEPPLEAINALSDALQVPGTRLLIPIPEVDTQGVQFNSMGEFAATIQASGPIEQSGIRGNLPPSAATLNARLGTQTSVLGAFMATPEQGGILYAGTFSYFHGVRQAVFSPDGKVIVAIASAQIGPQGLSWLFAAESGTGRILWQQNLSSLQTPDDSHTPGQGRTRILTSVAFSPDGRRLRVAVENTRFDLTSGPSVGVLDGSELMILDAATGSPVSEFQTAGGIEAATWSRDGETAVLGMRDGSLLLWDANTGQFARQFDSGSGHMTPVAAVALSPDGTRAASSGLDGSLILWDRTSGQVVWRVDKAHAAAIRGLDFAPDGKTLVTASSDNTLGQWDAGNGERIKTFRGHIGDVFAVAVSPDGQFVASGGADTRLIVWDMVTGAIVEQLAGHRESISSVAFSSDGQSILSGSGDSTLRVWDFNANGLGLSRVLAQHAGGDGSARFSPDSKLVALASSGSQTVQLVDSDTGDVRAEFTGVPDVSNAIYSPDGRTLLTASFRQNGAVAWDIATGKVVGRFKDTRGGIVSLDYSHDGSHVVAAEVSESRQVDDTTVFSQAGNALTIRDARTFAMLLVLDTPPGSLDIATGINDDPSITSAVFSPDDRTVLGSTVDGDLLLWDAGNGQLLRAFDHEHTDAVWQVAFSPDGSRAVSASADDSAILWDVGTGHVVRRLEEHTADVNTVAFSPDGRQVVTGSSDGSMILWNVGDDLGQLVRRFRVGQTQVMSVAFSPDGRYIVSSDSSGRVIRWSIVQSTAQSVDALLDLAYRNRYVPSFTCEEREVYRVEPYCNAAHQTPVATVDYARTSATPTATPTPVVTGTPTMPVASPTPTLAPTTGPAPSPLLIVYSGRWSNDGTRLLTANADGTVRLWDTTTGRQLLDLTGHTDDSITGRWSPDNRKLVTANAQGTARIWDADTGELLVTLRGHTGVIWDALWSPDGTRILTGANDGTARIWDAESGADLFTLAGQTGEVRPYWSPDGSRVLTVADDGSARIWDAETGAELLTLAGHDFGEILRAAWSPDETRVVTTGVDGTARVWDVATGKRLTVFKGHTNWVLTPAWSPDGTLIVTTSYDQTARLWNAATGEQVHLFDGFAGVTSSAAWSPDGKRLLITSLDGTARIFDAASGDMPVRFTVDGSFYGGTWSADGARVAIGSTDGYARIWDAITGSILLTIPNADSFAGGSSAADEAAVTPTPVITMTATVALPTATATAAPAGMAHDGSNNGNAAFVGGAALWQYEGRAGQVLSLQVSADWDTVLIVHAPNGAILAENDDLPADASGPNLFASAIQNLTLPMDGVYMIEVRSWDNRSGGPCTLVITSN